MGVQEDIKNKVNSYFEIPFKISNVTNVPDIENYAKLSFGNTGCKGDFCFLFVDMRKSSQLVKDYGLETAASIYESFHEICVRIIKANEGDIRSFDGDRVMGVFSGADKENIAVKTAMEIGKTIENVLNAKLRGLWKKEIAYGIGIDSGETLVVKVGKGRDSNTQDLIWLGQACNYASYYSDRANNSIIINNKVFNLLNEVNNPRWKSKSDWANKILPTKSEVDILVKEKKIFADAINPRF